MLGRRLLPLCLAAAAGCGHGHLDVGKAYLGRGQLAVASEYFDHACEKGKSDACAALAETHARLKWQFRKQTDALTAAERYSEALVRIVALEEVGRRMAARGLGDDDASALGTENTAVMKKAIRAGSADLDSRQSRGKVLKSDLAACRQLLAYDGAEEGTAERCAQLREQFKLYAVLGAGGSGYASAFAGLLKKDIQQERLELLELVETNHPRYNAEINVRLGEPTRVDSGWFEAARDKYHAWVPKLDKDGNVITRTITIPPSKAAIDAAAKAKRPRPKSKKVKKTVYVQVAGDYRHFESRRKVMMPYVVEVKDLRQDRITKSLSGILDVSAHSNYHTYQGHPRARRPGRQKSPEGKQNARTLPNADQMIRGGLNNLVLGLAKKLVKYVE